jgi:hypothetical protein
MITVVTENDERTFNAASWVISADQTLSVFADAADGAVAEYAPGGWQYVLRTDSEVVDPKPPSEGT